MDTLECMRVYARVVDAGSFSEAARRLGISKALASKYVGQLEQRLGVSLLIRTTRKLTPTEVGTAYYARCARIVGEVEELEGSLQADHTTPRGHLRIAGPRIFGEDALVGCVRAFLEKVGVRPRIRVNCARPVRALALAGYGIGLCLLPTVRQDIATGRLVRLLEAYEAYDRVVYAVYPHSRHVPGKVRSFLDHLVDHFRAGADR